MKILPLWIFLGLVMYSTPSFSVADEGSEPFLTIVLQDNQLRIDARGVSLGQVINSIKKELSIEIKGLDNKLDKMVIFCGSSPSTGILLRKLLRHLGEKNYVYEYDDDRLVKVTVFPPGVSSAANDPLPDSPLEDQLTTVVEVVSVVGDTQAARLDLKTGDFILKYDGVRIFQYDDLIEESTKSSGPTPVPMIILRKDKLMTVVLERGFIGVRVRVIRLPIDALPEDLSSW